MQVGGLVPTNLEEAVRVANLLAHSLLIPKDMREKPADVLAALMLGADVGLAPMQALQSIAVINGRPSMWGDGMLAVVMAHSAFEDIAETWEEVDGGTAVCSVWRRGRRQPTVARFSHNDAQKAGLLSKDTYRSYERRMLKMRARSWALRDAFPDALRGIVAAEEAQDITAEFVASDVIPMPQRASEIASSAPVAPTTSRGEGGAGPRPGTTGATVAPSPRDVGEGAGSSAGAASAPESGAVAPSPQPPPDELPAAADRIAICQKQYSEAQKKDWWRVRSERGVEAYTWSSSIGALLEAFHASGAAVDLDTEKDARGLSRITNVQKFDAFGGAGREPGTDDDK